MVESYDNISQFIHWYHWTHPRRGTETLPSLGRRELWTSDAGNCCCGVRHDISLSSSKKNVVDFCIRAADYVYPATCVHIYVYIYIFFYYIKLQIHYDMCPLTCKASLYGSRSPCPLTNGCKHLMLPITMMMMTRQQLAKSKPNWRSAFTPPSTRP